MGESGEEMMKEKLFAFCADLGLDAVGIAPPHYTKEALLNFNKAKELDYLSGFESFAREMPELSDLLPDAKSVIVILFPYRTASEGDSRLATYAQKADYHQVTGQYMKKIADFLKAEVPGFSCRSVCDTAPVLEKDLAVQAGLGFIGKNHLLIHPKYGSYTVIGAMITNLALPFDKPLGETCLSCGRCREVCPGSAFDDEGNFNAKCCASYITQKKQNLSSPDEEILVKAGFLWGCDLCQKVCPHNEQKAPSPLLEFQTPMVEQLLNEDFDDSYKERFSKTVFAYKGAKIMKRNMDLLERGKEANDQ